jgi:hypothetical protein
VHITFYNSDKELKWNKRTSNPNISRMAIELSFSPLHTMVLMRATSHENNWEYKLFDIASLASTACAKVKGENTRSCRASCNKHE